MAGFWPKLTIFLTERWLKRTIYESAGEGVWWKNVLPLVNQMNLTGKIFAFRKTAVREFMAGKSEVLPRFELGLLDSKSKVIAITP